MRRWIMQCVIASGLAALVAIGGLSSCSDSVDQTETGTLRAILVDTPTPLADVDSLTVVFEKVLVHRSSGAEPSDAGWFVILPDTLPVEARTFDLLELVNGVFAALGEVELETGRYTQIRIMLESATLYVNGAPQNLSIPSGAQTGIKLVGGFTIRPDEITEIAVDFDVARSLHEDPPSSGNYILRPTIRLVQTTLSGTISGTVIPTGIGAVLYALNPANGDTAATTLADPVSGAYVLQAVLAGTYDVRAEAVGYQDSTRTGITVTAGADTPDVDFELAPSGN
ncbi:MAG: hypothetical protein H6Q78_1037 [Candidatus Krumholzibacteriota bacterium]|nr:hypothetical protein [Candidatus Krumholzibacteriota bacterium]